MQQSRGNMCASRIWSIREMGLGNPEPHVDRAIEEFVKRGEAVAVRWIEMPKGILLLLAVPGRPASGAVYLYDRIGQDFYMLGFEGPDDCLTLEEFCELMSEYNLLSYAEEPVLLLAAFQAPGTA